MRHPPPNEFRLGPRPFSGFSLKVRNTLAALFFAEALLVWLRLSTIIDWPAGHRWPEGALIVLAAALVMASLALELPAQNLMAVGLIAAGIGGAAHVLNSFLSIPFGPCVYLENAGQLLFPPLPWTLPVLWVLVPLAARGTARTMLAGFQGSRNFGFLLLAFSVALIVGFSLGLEPCAKARNLWVWGHTRLPLTWHTAPLTNFLAWGLTGMLILLFATPFLLVKKPGPRQTDYLPLLVWCTLNLCLATEAAARKQWLPVAVSAVFTLGPVVMSLASRQKGRPGE